MRSREALAMLSLSLSLSDANWVKDELFFSQRIAWLKFSMAWRVAHGINQSFSTRL